jgi:hypothetical protein
LEEFILTKKHNIAYTDHSYKRKELIKHDYANNNITYDKLKNYGYLKLFLKEFCIVHKNLKFENLYKKLLEEFPDIKITLTTEEKKTILKKSK